MIVSLRDRRCIHVFPTTSGLHVELAQLPDGRLVIVKKAAPQGYSRLTDQARQMIAVGRAVGHPVFPRVLSLSSGELVMEYVSGETLRELRQSFRSPEVERSLQSALVRVFALSVGIRGGPPGRGFLARQLNIRLRRVAAALDRAGGGIAIPAAVRGLAAEIGIWDERLSPPRLAFGIHGDLTPQNILYTRSTGAVSLIDPRGSVLWAKGRPWWDPAFDLAAMVAFHAVIDHLPDITPGDAIMAAKSAHARLVDACGSNPRVAQWSALDRRWADRGRVAAMIRLLGNVSVQLAYFPQDGLMRARTLLTTCELMADDLMGGRVALRDS